MNKDEAKQEFANEQYDEVFKKKNTLQGTKEWFDDRRGKFTASCLNTLLVKGKTKDSLGVGAKTLVMSKVAERLSTETRKISSEYMDWGTEHEPNAIALFEELTGMDVEEAPFVNAPDDKFKDISGGSPDGLVYDFPPTPLPGEEYPCRKENFLDAILEVKCPHDPANHLYSLMHKDIPKKVKIKYVCQMQWNMYCCNVQKCYFISYDPRMKEDKHKIVIIEFERDEAMIGLLKKRILLAEDYLQEVMGELQ